MSANFYVKTRTWGDFQQASFVALEECDSRKRAGSVTKALSDAIYTYDRKEEFYIIERNYVAGKRTV